jgi:hypothetical protein
MAATVSRSPPDAKPLTAWQRSWRLGVAPHLPPDGLRTLQRALATGDLGLVRRVITDPSPLETCGNLPVLGATGMRKHSALLWTMDKRNALRRAG